MSTLTPTQLEVLRVRIGLESTDTSKDPLIQSAWDLSQSLAERYCDRLFDYMEGWTETFTAEGRYSVSLERYPVASVASVVDDYGHARAWSGVDKKAGVLFVNGGGMFGQAVYGQGLHNGIGLAMTVTYSGGYQTLPPDLMAAITLTFDNAWAAMNVSAAEAVESRAVRAITVPDVGKVEYVTDGSDSYSGGVDPVGLIPGGAVSILSLYRREKA